MKDSNFFDMQYWLMHHLATGKKINSLIYCFVSIAMTVRLRLISQQDNRTNPGPASQDLTSGWKQSESDNQHGSDTTLRWTIRDIFVHINSFPKTSRKARRNIFWGVYMDKISLGLSLRKSKGLLYIPIFAGFWGINLFVRKCHVWSIAWYRSCWDYMGIIETSIRYIATCHKDLGPFSWQTYPKDVGCIGLVPQILYEMLFGYRHYDYWKCPASLIKH